MSTFQEAAMRDQNQEGIYTVLLTDESKPAREFFRQYKEELKETLQQEEILIVEKDVDLL